VSFYRMIDHTGDLGMEVPGESREKVLARAAEALFDLLAERDRIQETETRTVRAEGEDAADLLVNFLRECLYLFSGKGFLVRSASVRPLEGMSVEAELRGEPFDPGRHRIRAEIKAVTWHRASLERVARGPGGDRWEGRVIFDV